MIAVCRRALVAGGPFACGRACKSLAVTHGKDKKPLKNRQGGGNGRDGPLVMVSYLGAVYPGFPQVISALRISESQPGATTDLAQYSFGGCTTKNLCCEVVQFFGNKPITVTLSCVVRPNKRGKFAPFGCSFV